LNTNIFDSIATDPNFEYG